jgi:UDP-glucose 4-epimerase
MRVLVTGGAGYIGSVVAWQLFDAGHDVTVLDNLSNGNRRAVPPKADLVVGDLSEREKLAQLFRTHRFEAVLHFGASIEAGESMKCPEAFFRNNTANTAVLLDTMLTSSVNRFVFSSTAAVYGNPVRTPIQEEDALKPTNAYGESKLLVERMLEWLHRLRGLRYASLRYFNAAGAAAPDRGEAHQPETHLIPRIFAVALERQKHVEIFGEDYATPDGTCVRDYIHVSDLAQAHLLALHALERPERLIYNLGNGQGFSVREVIDGVARVTGMPITVVESPRREGDPAILIASSEKIRRELNWQPKFTGLEDILRSAWEWHKNFPNGYGAN